MGLLQRITMIFRAKANSALDAAEDPRQTLDCSYERQLELLRGVKRGIVEITAAKRRLELQAADIKGHLAKLDDQARQALQMDREDLARAALERKQVAVSQLRDFDVQIAELQGEQERLIGAEARLAAKIEAFKTRKEIVGARYTAANAQVRIGEALSGISEEAADVGYSIRRAEEKTLQLQSRGQAIDELIDHGVLSDALSPGSALDRELAQLESNYNVEAELSMLRRELETPTQPKRLESGQ